MRIHIISDLHLEFRKFTPPEVEADVTVLAGDISQGLAGLRWIENAFPDRPVIYVPGNHEYYANRLPQLTDELRRSARDTNIFVLENEAVEIDGVTFLGSTLWTDYALDGDAEIGSRVALNLMSDFLEINRFRGKPTLVPEFFQRLHQTSRAWLRDTAAKIRRPKVIVTHHAPHPKSIAPQFAGNRLNPAFASDLTDVIESAEARLWIHGHIHWNSDYRVGKTRIINNPRGYMGENVNGFDPNLVVEIE
jgi:Icc-related predicted phosphoesterase